MQLTYEDKQAIPLLIGIFCVYLLRKHKPFDTIWTVTWLFIVITLTIATAGMIWVFIKKLFK
jgi:hypothetical protein